MLRARVIQYSSVLLGKLCGLSQNNLILLCLPDCVEVSHIVADKHAAFARMEARHFFRGWFETNTGEIETVMQCIHNAIYTNPVHLAAAFPSTKKASLIQPWHRRTFDVYLNGAVVGAKKRSGIHKTICYVQGERKRNPPPGIFLHRRERRQRPSPACQSHHTTSTVTHLQHTVLKSLDETNCKILSFEIRNPVDA